MKFSISWIVALLAGVLVLVGYFLPDVILLVNIQQIMLQVAMFVAAFGILAGVFNLLSVHWRRFEGNQKGSVYSLVLLLAFLLPLFAVGVDLLLFTNSPSKPFGLVSQWLFNYLILPVETTLFALLAVVLAYFAARMLRWRTNAFGLIFFGSLLFALAVTSPYLVSSFPQQLGALNEMILQPLVLGGGRGILLGVALGVIATGIRVLMGADRPYG